MADEQNPFGFLDEAQPSPQAEDESPFGFLDHPESSQIKNAAQIADGMGSPQAQRILKLSSQLGVSPFVVKDSPDNAEKVSRLSEYDFDEFQMTAPKLTEWLGKDPVKLKALWEDLTTVKQVEEDVKHYGFFEELARASHHAFAKAGEYLAQSPLTLGGGRSAFESAQPFLAQDMGGILGDPELETAVFGAPITPSKEEIAAGLEANPLARPFKEWAKQNANLALLQEPWEKFDYAVADGNYPQAGRIMLINTAAQAPQMLLSIAAIFATRGRALLLGLMGVQKQASKFEEGIKAEGVSPRDAYLNSIGSAGIEVATEKVELGIFDKIGKRIANRYGRETLKTVITNVVGDVGLGVAAEIGEEEVVNLSDYITDKITGIDKTPFSVNQYLKSAYHTAVASVGSAGLTSTTASAGYRTQVFLAAQRDSKFYEGIMKRVQQIKAKEAAPGITQEILEVATQNSSVKDVSVDAVAFKTFFQKDGGKTPEQEMAELGVLKEYEQAVESGGNVKVPLSKWAGKYAGTPVSLALKGDVAFGGRSTLNQQVKLQENMTKLVESAPGIIDDPRLQEEGVLGDPEKLKGIVETKSRADELINFYTDLGNKFPEQKASADQAIDTIAGFRETLKDPEGDRVKLRAGIGGIINKTSTGLSTSNIEGATDLWEDVILRRAVTMQKDPLAVLSDMEVTIQQAVNQGQVDPATGRVLYQKNLPAVQVQPTLSPLGLYSKVEEEVLKMDFKSMPAKDLANRVKNLPGVKAEELEEMGFYEWLELQESRRGHTQFIAYDKTTNTVLQVYDGHTQRVEAGQDPGEALIESRQLTDEHFQKFHKESPALRGHDLELQEKPYDSKVTKEEVLNFIRNNGVRLEQKVLSEDFVSERQRKAEAVANAADVSWSDEEVLEPDSDRVWDDANANYLDTWDEFTNHLVGRGDENYPVRFRETLKEAGKKDVLKRVKEFEKALNSKEVAWSEKRAIWRDYRELWEEHDFHSYDAAQTEAYDRAREWLMDPGNVYNDRKVVEEQTGFELVGNDEWGWHSNDLGKSYELSLEEAKVQFVQDLIEEGHLESTIEEDEDTDIEEQSPETFDPNKPVGRAKFKSYTVPGGTNYREFLLTLPDLKGGSFRGHFEVPNVMVHIRTTDRVDAEGKKVLFIEEIQSDLHQQGREKGYERDSILKGLKAGELPPGYSVGKEHGIWFGYEPSGEQFTGGDQSREAAIETALHRIRNLTEGELVPDAPFKATDAWAQLAMKRMLKVAAEQGYDSIAIAPAEVHIDRWGTDVVSWKKVEGGVTMDFADGSGSRFFATSVAARQALERGDGNKYNKKTIKPFSGYVVSSNEQLGGNAGGIDIENEARNRGELLEGAKPVTTIEELRSVISDILRRERNERSLEALTQNVWKQMQEKEQGVKKPRAEGFQFFYDNLIPKKVLPAILKKLDKDAKVEVDEVQNTLRPNVSKRNDATGEVPLENMKAWAIKLTDKMKAEIQKGFTLFQKKTAQAGFKEVTPERYVAERKKNKRVEMLSPTPAEKLTEYKLFLTDDGVGYALDPKGDLQGVFNNSGREGAGVDAVIHAIGQGAKTLDCYAGFLPQYYSDLGFVFIKSEAFNDEYAPTGWNYERYGKPDVVYMEFPGYLSRDSEATRARHQLAGAERERITSGEKDQAGSLNISAQYGTIDWGAWGGVGQEKQESALGRTSLDRGDVEDRRKFNIQLTPEQLASMSKEELFDHMSKAIASTVEAVQATTQVYRDKSRADIQGFNIQNVNALLEDAENPEFTSVGALDLDGLKTVNDTFGMANGSKLLAAFADYLTKKQGDGSLVQFYRIGGDEFAFLYKGDKEAADKFAAELKVDALKNIEFYINHEKHGLINYKGVAFSYATQNRTEKPIYDPTGENEDTDVGFLLADEDVGGPVKLQAKERLESGDKEARATPGLESRRVRRVEEGSEEWKSFLSRLPDRRRTGLDQRDDQGPLGQITFLNDQAIITLFDGKNPSTLPHESMHLFVREMQKDIAELRAKDPATLTADQQRYIEDADAMLEFAGAESFETLTEEGHEKIARAFEAYLMRGIAPSKKLRRSFKRFSIWLMDLYGRAKMELNVELTPEMIRVFDNMLATEIESAKARGTHGTLFDDPKAYGFSQSDAERYRRAIDDSVLAQEETVRQKLLKEQERDLRRERRALRKVVAEEVAAHPEYLLLARLKEQGIKIDGNAVIELIGKENYASLPPGLAAKNGTMSPDEVADAMDYPSATVMLESLQGLPPLKEAIDAETDRRMFEIHGDMLLDGRISKEAVDAYNNQDTAERLYLELEMLASENFKAFAGMTKRIGKRLPSREEIKESARRQVARMPISELSEASFRRAMERAQADAMALFLEGKYEEAWEAKRKELLNHEIVREVLAAKKEIDSAMRRFKALRKSDEVLSKTRDIDLVNAARMVLHNFGLYDQEGKHGKDPVKYLKQLQADDPDRHMALEQFIDNALADISDPIDYKQISFERFTQMRDATLALWNVAKSLNEVVIEGKKMQRQEIVGELNTEIAALDGKQSAIWKVFTGKYGENPASVLLGFSSLLTKAEHWADAMGPAFKKYLTRPVFKAIDECRERKIALMKQLGDALKGLTGRMHKRVIAAPELGGAIKKDFRGKNELLGALRHIGNESNLMKLLVGYGWGTVNEDTGELDTSRWDAFLARMFKEGEITKEDMDVIQAEWDIYEGLKPELQRAFKDQYGYYFDEIPIREVVTPFGTYRGGYVPAIRDPILATAVETKIAAENLLTEQAINVFPTTGRGATISRTAGAEPLLLSMKAGQSHLDWAARFIYINPAINQVGRILNDRSLKASLNAFDRRALNGLLLPWLQRSARQRKGLSSTHPELLWLNDVARFIRRFTGLQYLGFNATNALQNFSGEFLAATKVNPIYLAKANTRYLTSPFKMTAEIAERSKFMKNRLTTQLFDIAREMDEIVIDPSKFEKVSEWVNANAYVLSRISQNFMDRVAWLGAYEQAIDAGKSETDSVYEADETVRLTQGSFEPESMSRIEFTHPMVQLVLMFFSYFNNMANLNVYQSKKNWRSNLPLKSKFGRQGFIFVVGSMLPALLTGAIRVMMSGDDWDEDDDGEVWDDLQSFFFNEQINQFLATVPAGSLAKSIKNLADDKFYNDKLTISPGLEAVFGAGKGAVAAPGLVMDLIEGEKVKKQEVRDFFTLLGLMSKGLPVLPLAKPLLYLQDVQQGEASPTGPIDFTRGLLTGKPGGR